MKFPFIQFEQPAGVFYLAALPAVEVIRISKVDPRKVNLETMETSGGVQREPSWKRIREISEYADTVDAAFPTPILLAVSSSNCIFEPDGITVVSDEVADIVDGQHRVRGIAGSERAAELTLPVVFMLDATEEQKALLFATINGKQTKVPASLVYDLFGVTSGRSPQKTAHEIARAMNTEPSSPWYRRLKMLGRKSYSGSTETLSQGTFVKFLLPNISSKPEVDLDLLKRNKPLPPRNECIFNDYFREERDSVILKILTNVFDAARQTWPSEWQDPNSYVLTKTLGFSGIMRALPELVSAGKRQQDLSQDYFSSIFIRVRNVMQQSNMQFTSRYFSASGSGEAQFERMIEAQIAT